MFHMKQTEPILDWPNTIPKDLAVALENVIRASPGYIVRIKDEFKIEQNITHRTLKENGKCDSLQEMIDGCSKPGIKYVG